MDIEKPQCLEMAAVALARAFDEAASMIRLVDPLDRDSRRALRLAAYGLLVESRKQAAVNYLASDLDQEIERLQPQTKPVAGAEGGFFGTSPTGRGH